MSAPAWQTEELVEEWVESSPSPPTTPALEAPTRGSVHNKRGSLRSLGHGSAARALPPSRRGSAASVPEGRSMSNPYMRNVSGMLSPPTSASSEEGADRVHERNRSVSAPPSQKGTFVVKEGEDTHGKAFPKNPFLQSRDMFAALPLERMFDPPSPPPKADSPIPEEDDEPTAPYPHSTFEAGTPERIAPQASADVSTTPRSDSTQSGHSPLSFGSTPSSGSATSRRVSHQYAPTNPSRLSKSITPSSDNSFTTTTNSSRVPTPAPGEEDMSLESTHEVLQFDDSHADGPTQPYEVHSTQQTFETHPIDNTEDEASPVRRHVQSSSGKQRQRAPQSPGAEELPADYPFTFTAEVPERESSEAPSFEPSLGPLEGGEPSHSTLRTRPASTNLGLRLFRNTYDTYTREHLSALVDSIAGHPSPPTGLPNRQNLRDWSPDHTDSGEYRSSSESVSTPESGHASDTRSSKRLRLSMPSPELGPRGPGLIRDWRAQGNAMLERIRVTDPAEMSLTSDSRSGSHSVSDGWSVRSASESRNGPSINYNDVSQSPEPEPVVKSNPSTASSTYLHRAEDMMSRIKQRIVSPPTSTSETSPVPEEGGVLSESSRVNESSSSHQSSEAESHIPRVDTTWRNSASPAKSNSSRPKEQAQRTSIAGAGQPPGVPARDDLNRYISSSTAATATTMSTSFVKHRGPPEKAHMTMIRPGDVTDVVPDRIGKMRYDRATMRWVRETGDSLTRVDEAGESVRGSEDSADPFAGFDTTSPSVDHSPLPDRNQPEDVPVVSPRWHMSTSSPERHWDSSPEKPWSPERKDASTPETPPESSSSEKGHDDDDQQATPRARPRLNQSQSAPAGPSTPVAAANSPAPLRSALRNANSTPASAMKKRAAWHSDLTPARFAREPSAAPSSGSNKRSVSFSDGYIIAQHIEAERAEISRVDGDRTERYERTDMFEVDGSWQPSVRTRRIQAALDGLAELNIEDTDEDAEPSPSPCRPARERAVPQAESTSSGSPESEHRELDEDSDSTVPISAFKSFRSFRRGDQTFLTECSFGVAHDRLVQLITDVQPFEPYWEQLRSIDLSNRGVESLARLKEFLPALDEAKLDDNLIDYLSGIPSTVRTLHVAGNRLSSLTSVNHLRNLHFLDISRNQLDSVSQLECLRHLRELVIDDNQITDLTGIMGIDCLVKLSVSGNVIEDVDLTHAKWAQLETLNLYKNKIKSIKGLEKLKTLSTLNLDSNRLDELEPASPMTALRVLRASDNRLSHIDVSLFPKVRTLFADNNALPGLSRSSSGGHRIENLSLRNQRVQSFNLTPEDLQAAKRLYLSGNRLDTDFLSTPVYSLVYLEAAACNLSAWPTGLATNAPNLRVLNVNYNFIADLDGLRGLTRLRKLMAVGCRLGTRGNAARGLAGLTSLEEVDLRMNPATLSFYLPILLPNVKPGKDKDGVASVPPDANWPLLDAQFRRQLPDEWYSRRLFYRGLVLAECPHLVVLDGIKVGRGERDKAARLLEYAHDVAAAAA